MEFFVGFLILGGIVALFVKFPILYNGLGMIIKVGGTLLVAALAFFGFATGQWLIGLACVAVIVLYWTLFRDWFVA